MALEQSLPLPIPIPIPLQYPLLLYPINITTGYIQAHHLLHVLWRLVH